MLVAQDVKGPKASAGYYSPSSQPYLSREVRNTSPSIANLLPYYA